MTTTVIGNAPRTTTYTYDEQNRLHTVTDPENGLTSYYYNVVGALERTELPNGTYETRTYDDRDHLLNASTFGPDDALLAGFSYELDNVGNRELVIEDLGDRTRVVDYAYDELYRLIGESIYEDPADPTDLIGETADRTISYAYDDVGNRLTRDDSADGSTSYLYDPMDRLLEETLTELAGDVVKHTYGYDANGNTISKTSVTNGTVTNHATYGWDPENRLVGADTDGDGTSDVTYEYDADGMRVAKADAAEETRFLLDKNRPYAQVLEEYPPGGILQVSYVHGLDLISQDRHGDTGKSFYHVDGLGSTRALSSASGIITDRYIYDAFGRTIGEEGLTGNVHLFAGEARDSVVGLDYLRARWMDTDSGRFVARDGFEGVLNSPVTLHRYLYVGANPVNDLDPNGNFSLSSVLATVGIIGILVTIPGDSTPDTNKSSIRAKLFTISVVEPALKELSRITKRSFDSKDAVHLLVGTALQESLLIHRRQIGGGPARGFFQMEPSTHDDIFKNYLAFRKSLKQAVESFQWPFFSSSFQLQYNDRYAAVMARVHYARVPASIPSFSDVKAMANYWKTYYNTPLGKGAVKEFEDKYRAARLDK